MSKSTEFDQQQLDSEVYTKAQVHREELSDKELSMVSNEILRAIGHDLNTNKEAMEYLGSTAVHIYKPKTLTGLMFISQVGPIGDVPENIASKALESLRSDLMSAFGRRRPLKRSGY